MTQIFLPHRNAVVALAFMASSAIVTNAVAAADLAGVWINDSGRGAVEIKPCGKAMCGHVVWVKDTSDTKGCGKQIIGDAESVGNGVWDNGWIYSPEKRKNYDVELKPLNDGTLRVVGYAGTRLFSRTMIWTRAPADLKRCGDVVAALPAKPELLPAAAQLPKPVEQLPANPKQLAAPPIAATPPASSTESAKSAPSESAPPNKAADTTAKPLESTKPVEAEASGASTPQPADTQAKTTEQAKDTSDDDSQGGEKPGERKHHKGLDLGELKLGDLGLDKVLTKTKSGKCKLDLPFIKVVIDCKQD